MVSKKAMKAIRFRANAATGVGKIISGGLGAVHQDFYVDLLKALKVEVYGFRRPFFATYVDLVIYGVKKWGYLF